MGVSAHLARSNSRAATCHNRFDHPRASSHHFADDSLNQNTLVVMASKKIDDRTKYLSGPWDVIKGKNADLAKGNLFKPPMDPLCSKYDNDKSDYEDFKRKKKELRAQVQKMMSDAKSDSEESKKLHDEFDKAHDEESTKVSKCWDDLEKYANDEDADPKDVMATMTSLADEYNGFNSERKAIMDKLTALSTKVSSGIKKDAADYKSQADAIQKGIEKLENDMNSLDDQIRKLVSTYQQIAVKNKKEEIADAVRGILNFL
jgi:hypothetical protein